MAEVSQNETGNAQGVNQMKIIRTSHIQNKVDRNRQQSFGGIPQSRAIVPLRDVPFARRRPPGANPNRRASAFLAHLALQYDGVSVRRVKRAERLKTAISSYGTEAPMRNAPHFRSTRDMKI